MARVKPLLHPTMIVRPHSPWRRRILLLLILALLAAALWASFEYGRYRAGYDKAAAKSAVADLQHKLAAAEKSNREMRAHIALLEQSQHIDQQARARVKGNLSDLQSEILELREELAFYRGIVSPDDNTAGLKVQRFSVTRGAEPRVFHFHLVLIQAIKHDRKTSGTASLQIVGSREGKDQTLDLKDLRVNGDEDIAFAFRYFQDFDGDFRLPAGFTPSRVVVRADPSGRDNVVEKSYDWAALNN